MTTRHQIARFREQQEQYAIDERQGLAEPAGRFAALEDGPDRVDGAHDAGVQILANGVLEPGAARHEQVDGRDIGPAVMRAGIERSGLTQRPERRKTAFVERVRQREIEAAAHCVAARVHQGHERGGDEETPVRAHRARAAGQIAPEPRRPRGPRQDHEADNRAPAGREPHGHARSLEHRIVRAEAEQTRERHRDQIEHRAQAGRRTATGFHAAPPADQAASRLVLRPRQRAHGGVPRQPVGQELAGEQRPADTRQHHRRRTSTSSSAGSPARRQPRRRSCRIPPLAGRLRPLRVTHARLERARLPKIEQARLGLAGKNLRLKCRRQRALAAPGSLRDGARASRQGRDPPRHRRGGRRPEGVGQRAARARVFRIRIHRYRRRCVARRRRRPRRGSAPRTRRGRGARRPARGGRLAGDRCGPRWPAPSLRRPPGQGERPAAHERSGRAPGRARPATTDRARPTDPGESGTSACRSSAPAHRRFRRHHAGQRVVTERPLRGEYPPRQVREQSGFRLVARNQQRQVRRPCLRDPIDASDALLEARRIPRQFEADDPSRPRLQVQPLSRDIGGQQHRRRTVKKLPELQPSLRRVLAAVQHRDRAAEAEPAQDDVEGVPKLGEDDHGFGRPMDERDQALDLALLVRGNVGQRSKAPQPRPFVPLAQARVCRETLTFLAIDEVGFVVELEPRLRPFQRRFRPEVAEPGESPRHRLRQGRHRGQRALAEHRQQEQGGIAVAGARGHRLLESAKRREHARLDFRQPDRMPADPARRPVAERGAGAPEDRQRLVGCGGWAWRVGRREPAQVDEARESHVIAAVRRRGQQNRAVRSAGQVMAEFIPIRVAADRMRFVDDDQIPGIGRKRIHHVPLFQKVRRCEPNAGPAPGTVAESAGPCQRVETRAVGGEALDAEAPRKFLRPLVAERGWSQHEDPPGNVSPEQFGHDESGLDGLAESDFVGDQQARTPGENCHRGFQLVGQDVRRGVHGRRRHAHVVGTRQEVREPRQGLLGAHAPRRRHANAHDHAVEWRQKRLPAIVPGYVEPDDVSIAVRALDAPACAADPNKLARPGNGAVHFLPPSARRGSKNLQHRPSIGPICGARGGLEAKTMPRQS